MPITVKEHLFDKRIVKRALQEGLLDKAAYQRVLDELPDLAHRIQNPEQGPDQNPDLSPDLSHEVHEVHEVHDATRNVAQEHAPGPTLVG